MLVSRGPHPPGPRRSMSNLFRFEIALYLGVQFLASGLSLVNNTRGRGDLVDII